MIEFFSDPKKALDGMEELSKKRLEICEKCEHFTEAKICGKCGCFLPLKTRFEMFKCPLNKW